MRDPIEILETSPDPAYTAMAANAAIRHPLADCWLWWQGNIPTLPGERLGIIGRYRAENAASGRAVLEAACSKLSLQGCTLAIGPMEGNTWRSYRLVTDSDANEPPFFLEPTNPPDYPAHWVDAGFTPLATYRSSLTTELDYTDPRLERIRQRLEQGGLSVRPLTTGSLAQAETDLRAIYRLSLTSFAQAFLYTPLEEAEFIAQYRKVLDLLSRLPVNLTALAQNQAGELVGYLFALPDLNELSRPEHQQNRTLILKTLAIAPGRQWAGLGSLLTHHCQQRAKEAGFTRAIHALMHDSNASRNLSFGYASHPIRHYTLYARRLNS